MHLEELESPTPGSEDQCSIQLSYRCICDFLVGGGKIHKPAVFLKGEKNFEIKNYFCTIKYRTFIKDFI